MQEEQYADDLFDVLTHLDEVKQIDLALRCIKRVIHHCGPFDQSSILSEVENSLNSWDRIEIPKWEAMSEDVSAIHNLAQEKYEELDGDRTLDKASSKGIAAFKAEQAASSLLNFFLGVKSHLRGEDELTLGCAGAMALALNCHLGEEREKERRWQKKQLPQ